MRNFAFTSGAVALVLGLQLACAPSKSSESSPATAMVITQNQRKEPTTRKLESCFSPRGSCDQKIITFIHGAQKSLDIAIYSITHRGIVDAIEEAHKKGLQIRMVVDRTQSAGISSLVRELKEFGIPLKIGNTGRAIMHNKFTIVDGVSLETGSYNYTQNASSENAENQMYIFDPEIIQEFQNNFETLWANGYDRPIEPKSDTKQEGKTDGRSSSEGKSGSSREDLRSPGGSSPHGSPDSSDDSDS